MTEFKGQKIIVFDGICNFCTASVQFILKREKAPLFRFASIQSQAGKELLTWYGLPEDYSESIVLIDREALHLNSDAVLKIGQHLRFPWAFLSSIGFALPKSFRDGLYRQLVRNRYRWFGTRAACMVPAEDVRMRFL
jgi:predicted DCC family thiol-disulfide oxidoreductase YuxK